VRERIAVGRLDVLAFRYLGIHVVGPGRLVRRVVLPPSFEIAPTCHAETRILREICTRMGTARQGETGGEDREERRY
jgi:hypothetical protein